MDLSLLIFLHVIFISIFSGLLIYRKKIIKFIKKHWKKIVIGGVVTGIISTGFIIPSPEPPDAPVEVTYYFNSYDQGEPGETWETKPEWMVDGNIDNDARTSIQGEVELCLTNTYTGGGSGIITKVELRAYCHRTNTADIYLRPVFTGGDGDNHELDIGTSDAWSAWHEITTDTNAPSPWAWSDVQNLDCDVDAFVVAAFSYAFCAKVEVKVTYTTNNAPTQSNESPINQSILINNLPLLNVTCNDADGDTMNATWWSNSSGSWVQFASNETSFSNGSIEQTNSNFSNNYNTTYWWSVNLTDDEDWNNETYYFSMNGYFPYDSIYFNGTDNIVSGGKDDGTLVFDLPFDIAPDKSDTSLVEIWCGTGTASQFNSSNDYNISAGFKIHNMYCHLWQVWDSDSGVAGTEFSIGYNTTYSIPVVALESINFSTDDKLTHLISNEDPTNDTFNLTAFMWDVNVFIRILLFSTLEVNRG